MRKYTSLLVAAILPLLLFRWFVPNPVGQIDFWLLWLVAMLVVGLPVVFAEIGLANRSQQTPFAGIQQLTREADVNPIWRGFAWLSVLMALLIAALGIVAMSQDLLVSTQQLGIMIDVPNFAIALGLVVIATLLSLLAEGLLLAGLICIVTALILAVTTGTGFLLPDFVMTQTNLSEWARAVMLALISVGAGTGLYWFANVQSILSISSTSSHQDVEVSTQRHQGQKVASKVVFPIWLTQLIVGMVAIMVSKIALPPIAMFIYGIGVVIVSGYLVHYASSQFGIKFGRWVGLLAAFILLAVMVMIGSKPLLLTLLVVVSFIAVLILAIFSGWQMKISHMRKSFNFSSEGIYNLWRGVIRLLVPLLVLLALIGWFL